MAQLQLTVILNHECWGIRLVLWMISEVLGATGREPKGFCAKGVLLVTAFLVCNGKVPHNH